MTGWRLRCAAAVVAGLAGSPAAAAGEAILIGDLPYSPEQEEVLVQTIAPAVAASDIPLVIHLGDFKGGSEACGDALMQARRDQIHALKPGRVVFTPGDNDWTDCDRDGTGLPMREYDRLDRLRVLFFSPAPEVPEGWGLERQPGYPENARWMLDGVVYATVHVVGTNDGRAQIYLDDPDAALARVAAREAANIAWLGAAAEAARETGADALVIAGQADVTEPWGSGPCTRDPVDCDAFADLRRAMADAAQAFGGPTLYVHGDSDPYCLDTGFGGEAAPNLQRLNSAGDYAVIDAVRLTIDPDSITPFRAETLVGGVAAGAC
jgi:hypothetical protein